jgi:hypothetical protein
MAPPGPPLRPSIGGTWTSTSRYASLFDSPVTPSLISHVTPLLNSKKKKKKCNAFAAVGSSLHKRNSEGSWFHCVNDYGSKLCR